MRLTVRPNNMRFKIHYGSINNQYIVLADKANISNMGLGHV